MKKGMTLLELQRELGNPLDCEISRPSIEIISDCPTFQRKFKPGMWVGWLKYATLTVLIKDNVVEGWNANVE